MTMLMIFHRVAPKSTRDERFNEIHNTMFCGHCKTKLKSNTNAHSADPQLGFCCRGCEIAYHLVHSLNLDQFYQISEPGVPVARETAVVDYSLYDSSEFQKDFVTDVNSSSTVDDVKLREAKLLIDGITCYACIWLIRNAVQRHFKLQDSRQYIAIDINQTTGAGRLKWSRDQHRLGEIIQFIENLGYRVHPYRGPQSAVDQSELIRVGVGLFLMMNVMSFALAEYFAGEGGLEPSILQFLRWISLLMALVSLGWTGRDFFINTYRSFIWRRPHIDAPILIGLLAATLQSIHSTFIGHGPVYFDSVTAIIALVVTGRFAQKTILRRNQAKMSSLLNPKDGWALVKRPDEMESSWNLTPVHKIKKGDLVRVLPGELLPVKSRCATACADISYEQLKGEAEWRTVKMGESIPAGTVNGAVPIEIVADQDGADSYLQDLNQQIESSIAQKGAYQEWSDKAAWFLFLVVFVTAMVVLWRVGQTDLNEAIARMIAIFLVACPCTFAIGTPLAFGTAMSRALRAGVLFKSQRAVEKLAEIRHIVFDKTGTLTTGILTVQKWTWLGEIDDQAKADILNDLKSLANASSHQVPQAIAKYAEPYSSLQSRVSFSSREDIGRGMTLTAPNKTYRVGRREYFDSLVREECEGGSLSWQQANTFIELNGDVICAIELDDELKESTKHLMNHLKDDHLSYEILSGDTETRAISLAKLLPSGPESVVGRASPLSKIQHIRAKMRQRAVAMVGNGLNDAGAMACSSVSIATQNASSTARNSSDICLLRDDMMLVKEAFQISKTAVRKIKTVFLVAVAYNMLGLTLAALGFITPVVAAVLMPISSATITKIATSWPNPRAKDHRVGFPDLDAARKAQEV